MRRAATAVVILLLACGTASVGVESLASRDRVVAAHAVNDAFRAGTTAIPALMKLRGDRRPFMGGALGSPMSAMATLDPSAAAQVGEERIVSVEAAALYLIEAIHRQHLDFAQSGYLTDMTLPAEQRRAANRRPLLERAWTSVETWFRSGMTGDPLAGSGVAFW